MGEFVRINRSVDAFGIDFATIFVCCVGAAAVKRLIFTYGIIAGLVIIVTNTISLEIGYGHAWLGFLVMFIAFSTIFVAIKQYRDETLGGVIGLGTSLRIGLGISVVASIVYVAIWELYLAATDYQFIEDYANSIIEAKTTSGASETELVEATSAANQLKDLYSNPVSRLPITFLEIFPIGFLVSLGSAFILRNHRSTD